MPAWELWLGDRNRSFATQRGTSFTIEKCPNSGALHGGSKRVLACLMIFGQSGRACVAQPHGSLISKMAHNRFGGRAIPLFEDFCAPPQHLPPHDRLKGYPSFTAKTTRLSSRPLRRPSPLPRLLPLQRHQRLTARCCPRI